MNEFLAMGGYAAFVWPAYGISAFGLGTAVVLVLRAYAKARSALAALERVDGGTP